MLATISLLFKMLVVQFYKLNSAFFLFIFLVMFGIVEPGQVVSYHLGLMQLILGSVAGMGLAMAAWLFYGYKCVSFVLNSVEKQENIFLINLQGLSIARQWFLFFCCQVILYLPVLVYAGFTIYIGLQAAQITGVASILIFQIVMCLGSAYLFYRKINSFHTEGVKLKIKLPFKIKFTKPPVLYLVYHIFTERKFAWLGLKIFASFIFYLVFVLHRSDFSLGYFRLLFLIITIAHSMLVFYCFEFTERQMAFTRNLPVTRTNRLLTYLVTYTVILLPELCWMLLYAEGILEWHEMLLTYSAGLGQLLLITSLLYLPNMQLQRFSWVICLLYFVSAILLPTGVAVVLLTEVALALFIFYRNYYTFEYTATEG